MTTHQFVFTVFTPTYNRAHTLHRVYESLRAQTFRDFEWLIVDDGSTDGTANLVRGWQAAADFPIRYIHQENHGKHWAMNRGAAEARGELFLPFDSDDACVPIALERLKWHWDAIPPDARSQYKGVTGLCEDETGRLVGTRFPRDVLDSDFNETRYRYKVRGEKWGFTRTDVMREFPFPEALRGQYVPEGIVWSAMSRRYKTRYVNEILRIYYVGQPSMVHAGSPAKNAPGGRLEHLTALTDEIDYFRRAPAAFLRSAVHYARFCFHLGISPLAQCRDLKRWRARVLWGLAVMPGYAVYLRDRSRERPSRGGR